MHVDRIMINMPMYVLCIANKQTTKTVDVVLSWKAVLALLNQELLMSLPYTPTLSVIFIPCTHYVLMVKQFGSRSRYHNHWRAVYKAWSK